MDSGLEPFRFIHFNIQAVRNMIIEGVKNLWALKQTTF
jgi:hypothetical protein